MIIKMIGLYGLGDNSTAFYQTVGDGCFQFVNDIKFASDLSEEEVAEVMEHEAWYCKQYRASRMEASERR